MADTNRQILLAARPAGYPKESDFQLVTTPIPAPGPGEILVRALYVSVDPYMRGRMNDVKSYAPPVQLGEVMTGGVVGEVLHSNHPRFVKGEIVQGMFGWQEYAVSDGAGVRRVDPSIAPVSTALGLLGMPGLTAYFGLLDICDPQPGETVVVSAAAGAVGSVVGQIAKIKGCRVVGTAGSDEKVEHITKDLGFNAGFNYRKTRHYRTALEALCPNGIDVYFDNVGGAVTDAVFTLLNVHARIAVCGQISQYNLQKPEMGPRLLWTLIVNRAKVQGFLVSDYSDRFGDALKEMAQWLKMGKLKYREDIVEGIENTPLAFLRMLKGENIGKQLVKVG